MASAAVSPPSDISYDEAMKTAERWATTGPTEEEQLDILKQVIKSLTEPGILEVTEQALTELATRAMQTSAAFAQALAALRDFATKSGAKFPGIIAYRDEWASFEASWRANLLLSKSYARQTAAEYGIYTEILRRVNVNMSKEEMLLVARDLKEFARNNPVDIPANYQDKFLDLKRDMGNYRTRLNTYLDQQKASLVGPAAALRRSIDALRAEIEDLHRQLDNLISSLGLASWMGLLGFPYPDPVQMIIAKIWSKTLEHNQQVYALKENEAAQSAMGDIIAQFIGMTPDFDNLVEFAQIWNSFHHDAVDFATKFESLESPANFPPLYLERIRLALEVSVPLVRGLNAYATIIN